MDPVISQDSVADKIFYSYYKTGRQGKLLDITCNSVFAGSEASQDRDSLPGGYGRFLPDK